MNANQLADELAFKHIAGDDSGAFSSKIITMLRQQQAEIEALKQSKSDGNNKVNFELTDNEIVWLWCDCEKDGTETTYIKFARAILRKAQEK